ncbi:hypothetical protein PFLmoz3_03974 [Pseudomonas fluorescens]|uniref:Uncharacterized protein n=1 Tax=Pseudomonas fluorescens TaxID=294 RepID=A0A109LF89_PSEFL|nr:hypothetical protein PFLmoz3_03974 [Pseudomonas fluorescens]
MCISLPIINGKSTALAACQARTMPDSVHSSVIARAL